MAPTVEPTFLQGVGSRIARRTTGALLRRRMRRHFHGSRVSFISSNCIGGRLSDLADEPYLSPTVGMFFRPHDFLAFASDLPRYLTVEPVFDAEETGKLGFPVGDLMGIKLLLLHYRSFAEAREKWVKRAALVDLAKVVLTFCDRGGASLEQLRRFDRLPHPKLLLVANAMPELRSALHVTRGHSGNEIGDLFAHWQHLAPVLTSATLERLSGQLHAYSVRARSSSGGT